MPRVTKQKRGKRTAKSTKARRTGLPAASSIQSVETFRSPKGKVYRIIRTNETDAGDTPKRKKP